MLPQTSQSAAVVLDVTGRSRGAKHTDHRTWRTALAPLALEPAPPLAGTEQPALRLKEISGQAKAPSKERIARITNILRSQIVTGRPGPVGLTRPGL
jgi:hypothetical protein